MTQRSDPPNKHLAITASANPIGIGVTAIYVGVAGNVTVTLSGDSVEYTVQAGTYLVGNFSHMTATTASGLVAVGQ